MKNCLSQWTALGSGVPGACYHDDQDHKNRRCRTYGISTVLFNGYGCPYANACRQWPLRAAPSQWIAWEQEHTELALMMTRPTRTRSAALTLSAERLPMMAMLAHTLTRTSSTVGGHPASGLRRRLGHLRILLLRQGHPQEQRCRLYKVRVCHHNGYACHLGTSTAVHAKNTLSLWTVSALGDYDACRQDYEHERCRIYSVTQPALNSGYACPHSDKLKQCTSGCGQPIDCEGEWTEYGSCNHVEDDHKNERCRTYVVTPSLTWRKGMPTH